MTLKAQKYHRINYSFAAIKKSYLKVRLSYFSAQITCRGSKISLRNFKEPPVPGTIMRNTFCFMVCGLSYYCETKIISRIEFYANILHWSSSLIIYGRILIMYKLYNDGNIYIWNWLSWEWYLITNTWLLKHFLAKLF